MRRGSWFNTFTAEGGNLDLPAETREELARLDDKLSAIWNLGDNVLIGWTRSAGTLLVLSVRHYAIPEAVHAGAARGNEIRDGMRGGMDDAPRFINEVLSGPTRTDVEEPLESLVVGAQLGQHDQRLLETLEPPDRVA